jgi:hypothetical protein
MPAGAQRLRADLIERLGIDENSTEYKEFNAIMNHNSEFSGLDYATVYLMMIEDFKGYLDGMDSIVGRFMELDSYNFVDFLRA